MKPAEHLGNVANLAAAAEAFEHWSDATVGAPPPPKAVAQWLAKHGLTLIPRDTAKEIYTASWKVRSLPWGACVGCGKPTHEHSVRQYFDCLGTRIDPSVIHERLRKALVTSSPNSDEEPTAGQLHTLD